MDCETRSQKQKLQPLFKRGEWDTRANNKHTLEDAPRLVGNLKVPR